MKAGTDRYFVLLPEPLFFDPLALLSVEESSALLPAADLLAVEDLPEDEASSGSTLTRMEAYEMPGTAFSARAWSG